MRSLVAGLAVAVGLLAIALGSAHASPAAAAKAGTALKCQHPSVHDAHSRWEVVFGLESTTAKAAKLKATAISRGFAKAGIEVECNGWSVANAGFKSRATALGVLKQAKAKGFTGAALEDS
jgi:hypothetical protein